MRDTKDIEYETEQLIRSKAMSIYSIDAMRAVLTDKRYTLKQAKTLMYNFLQGVINTKGSGN